VRPLEDRSANRAGRTMLRGSRINGRPRAADGCSAAMGNRSFLALPSRPLATVAQGQPASLSTRESSTANILVTGRDGEKVKLNGFGHRFALATGAPGAGAARVDRGHARLLWRPNNRGRMNARSTKQRPLCAGRHVLPDRLTGSTAVDRRDPMEGSMPYRPKTPPIAAQ